MAKKQTKLEQLIAKCKDKKLLRLLNRLWWKRYFNREKK